MHRFQVNRLETSATYLKPANATAHYQAVKKTTSSRSMDRESF
jgi:hypothetical protein